MSQQGVLTDSSSPAADVERLTADVGGACTPVAFNIDVQGTSSTLPSNSIITHTFAAGEFGIENRRWLTPYVVDSSAVVGSRGTYSTVQSAITAASGAGGGNIYIRAGTYTENLTLAADIALIAIENDAAFSGANSVNIDGAHTANFAGNLHIAGIAFTNSAAISPVFTLNTNSAVNFERCSIVATTVNCIVTNDNSLLSIFNSTLICTSSNAVILNEDSIAFLTHAVISALTNGIVFNGNSQATLEDCDISSTTAILLNSAASIVISSSSSYAASNTGISFVAAAAFRSIGDRIEADITAVGGAAGTFTYANLIFLISSDIAAGITQVPYTWRPWATDGTSSTATAGTASFDELDFTVTDGFVSLFQPSFLAYRSTTVSNATGDGTLYTILFNAEFWDKNSDFDITTGTLTSPITGKWQLNVTVGYDDLGAANTSYLVTVVTSNRSYELGAGNIGALRDTNDGFIGQYSAMVDMDAADTCTVTTQVFSGALIVDILGLNVAVARTTFSGQLISGGV